MLFLLSGAGKLSDILSFSTLIDAYGLIPQELTGPMAAILATLEVLAGIGMLLDIHGSLGVITALTLLFMAILGYGIRMGLDIDCGCFGPADPEAKAFHGLRMALYRDFLIMAGIVYLYSWRRMRNIRPTPFIFSFKTMRRTEQ
ncbi:MAG: MauE/DoxX family redox-associated membrane protein [Thermodesulfobacteriota bacterium]